MNQNDFINELKKINIELTEQQIKQLEDYKKFLKEYNEHTNLTRIIDDNDIYLKHFYDSLTVCKYIDLNNYNNLLDIGTGAGFPGMVLKIVYPNLEVTLLDSNNKKTTFLNELSKRLNIKVNIINDRSENYINNKRESYDIVLSRAVANLSILLELSVPFVKIDGYFIAMKGNAKEELETSKNTSIKLGASIESINEFNLIREEFKRKKILYKKNNKKKNKNKRKNNKKIKNQ